MTAVMPVCQKKEMIKEQPKPKAEDGGRVEHRIRALVVEDDPVQAEFFVIELERAGFSVVAACGEGAESLALTERLRPDVVFMDIELRGEVTGILAAKIMADELDVPVIYVSCHSKTEFGDALNLTFPMDYLQKPCSEKELARLYRFLKGGNTIVSTEDLQRGLLTMCAWTKKVKIQGEWIPVDVFLRDWCGFEITLGVTPEVRAKFHAATEGTKRDQERRIRVLVVEDDPGQALLLRADLERMGFSVVEVIGEGITAVSKAPLMRLDGVFMDIELQGRISGMWAGQAISEKLHIPVIFVSGHSPEEFAISRESTSPVAFLCKPYSDDDLLRILDFYRGCFRKSPEGVRKIAMCRWTKKVEFDGKWMEVDDFLKEICGIQISHGVAPEIANQMDYAV